MAMPLDRQLFNSANAYYLGATILMKPASSAQVLPIQPALTCAALSLKLYLKCLMAIEGKDDKDTYRFAELFRSLSKDTENGVYEKFKEFSNTSLSFEDFIGHMEAFDNAFAEWRYVREEEAERIDISDIEDMILAVKSAISGARPEWE